MGGELEPVARGYKGWMSGLPPQEAADLLGVLLLPTPYPD